MGVTRRDRSATASLSSRRSIEIGYTIGGIELTVDGPTAAVYAFDRSVHSVARLEEIVELGLSRGQIPVVRFDIPEVDAGEFIRHAFRRISVRWSSKIFATSPHGQRTEFSPGRGGARHRTALSTALFKPRCPATTTTQRRDFQSYRPADRDDGNESGSSGRPDISNDAPAAKPSTAPRTARPSHGRTRVTTYASAQDAATTSDRTTIVRGRSRRAFMSADEPIARAGTRPDRYQERYADTPRLENTDCEHELFWYPWRSAPSASGKPALAPI